MIVQIFEISSTEEAKKMVEIGVDYIGVLVGKGKYPRELSNEEAKIIFQSVPPQNKKVALSLSDNLEEISEIIKRINPDILFLGTFPESLSPDNVREIKQKFPRLEIMRTIPITNEKSIELAKQYDGVADYLLLDTVKDKNMPAGATGETHNWDISQKIVESVKIPVILAGGLGPDNVAEAIRKVKPAGVDSKTKTDITGSHKKDLDKVREFVKIAKSF